MARGTQHRKRRPAQNARAAAVAAAPKKQRPPQWQEELFFQRLRVHAKGVFVLLALVFAVSFVFLGVGSGANGITDALQNAFNFGRSSGGASISSLEHKTQKHPLDAQAWRDLATAYEAKHRTNDAIVALSQYVGLRSKDQSALAELAGQYTTQAQQYAADYQAAAQDIASQTPPAAVFAPPANTPFGKAFADPNALQDPISTTLQQAAQAKQNAAFSNYTAAQRSAEQSYAKLAKLTPSDPNAQLQLAQAAQAAQDSKVALAAYKKFLKLAPTDPLAASVRTQVKALEPKTAATTSKSKSK